MFVWQYTYLDWTQVTTIPLSKTAAEIVAAAYRLDKHRMGFKVAETKPELVGPPDKIQAMRERDKLHSRSRQPTFL